MMGFQKGIFLFQGSTRDDQFQNFCLLRIFLYMFCLPKKKNEHDTAPHLPDGHSCWWRAWLRVPPYGFTDKRSWMGMLMVVLLVVPKNSCTVSTLCAPKVIAVMVINNILLLVFACPRVNHLLIRSIQIAEVKSSQCQVVTLLNHPS